jgi:flagella basal body P-ring formation protein FlgA
VNQLFHCTLVWATLRGAARVCLAGLLASGAAAWAQLGTDPSLAAEVQHLAQEATAGVPGGARVEVEMGRLDARLRLAPCARITPYLPPNSRPWGVTRLGLRCTDGARWNVYVPVTVKVFALAPAAVRALPLGTLLTPSDLAFAQVDLASEASPVLGRPEEAIGRALIRPLRPGQALRQADLKPRQWFAAGDMVRIVAAGSGYSISAEGLALTAGIDGQNAKVRAESGRIVSGRPNGQRQIEVPL